MDSGKDKNAIITAETGNTRSTGCRRTWSKPIVKRIGIKRTMAGSVSNTDSSATDSPGGV
jgi:hypothetical protein